MAAGITLSDGARSRKSSIAALFLDLDVEALAFLVEGAERNVELFGSVGLVAVAALRAPRFYRGPIRRPIVARTVAPSTIPAAVSCPPFTRKPKTVRQPRNERVAHIFPVIA